MSRSPSGPTRYILRDMFPAKGDMKVEEARNAYRYRCAYFSDLLPVPPDDDPENTILKDFAKTQVTAHKLPLSFAGVVEGVMDPSLKSKVMSTCDTLISLGWDE